MSKQEIQKHGGSLTRPNKGETMNPQGRPRKFDTVLVNDYGYKSSEIADTIKVMLVMTIDELKLLLHNEATILEKVIAVALLKSIKTGNISILESLLNRAYGKPCASPILAEQDDKQITSIEIIYNYPDNYPDPELAGKRMTKSGKELLD